MKERYLYRTRYILLLFAFLPLLYFPVFNEMVPLVKKKITKQAHEEKPFPVINLKRLDRFPGQCSDYFCDELKIKNTFATINSIFKLGIMHESRFTNYIIRGKDNWLFIGTDRLQKYQRSNPLSTVQLDSIQMIFKMRKKWLNDRGIKFYVAIAPNKHEIYPEYLPSNIRQFPLPDRTDQVIDRMKNDTDVVIIDLRKIILQHKKPTLLYFKTDSHWNDLGGFWAYTEIMNRIHKDFPSVGPVMDLNDFTIDSSETISGGEAVYLNMEKWYFEKKIKLIPKFKEKGRDGKKMNYKPTEGFAYPQDFEIVKEINNDSMPTAVFIRDSYADYVIPYLKEHFSKSVYIFDGWHYSQNREIIEHEKPKIVVLFFIDHVWENILHMGMLP